MTETYSYLNDELVFTTNPVLECQFYVETP